MNIIKCLTVFASALVLSACGGGGGEFGYDWWFRYNWLNVNYVNYGNCQYCSAHDDPLCLQSWEQG